MANEMQRGNLTGTAIMRIPISGAVNISGKQMKELRFMPYSEFPEEGREDVLYIDTDGNAMYYWDGTEYISLSGGGSGGTSNYNELSNKPSINDITLTGNKTSAELGLQPTISDLATIRSGAASGATAVQPSDMETALASKQDVIDDLSDIRTGAAAGETAVQPSALETALSEKQDVISDLADIRSGASAGATALQPEDIDTLPTDGSSNPVSSGGTYNFVNSSIATNTAYFIGTFASVAELEAYTGTVTNNDYAFVTSTDSAGNTLYNRYKYNAATQTWSFEYAVNNTTFTTAQWAAIQSGMTSADKTKLDGIETGANKTVIDASPTSGSDNAVSSGGVHTALSGKQDTIADLSDIRSGASAGATAVQPSALTDYQTKLSGTNKLDPSYIDYDASHRAVSDTEKSTWNGKQNAISDLSTIRSGAAAGATALQQSDVSSTYSASGTAPVNGTAVNAAIGTLDVSSVGGSGKYISAISETNGKIAATPTTFDTALSSSSTNSNAPTSKAVYDDQQRQEVEIGAVANAGAKNFCPKETETSTGSGFTSDVPVNIPAGTYILSFTGTLAYTASLSLYRALPHSGNSLANINLSATTGTQSIEFTISETAKYIAFYHNGSGNSLTNIMFRPSLITDSTFVPYAKTNRELTVENASQQSEINYAVNTGAKNLLNPADYIANSRSGVTIIYNGDGTYSLSGTPTQTSDYLYTPDNIYTDLYGLQTGQTYTISTGVENSKVLIRIIPSYDGTSYDWSNPIANNVSVEATFTIPSNVVGLLIDFRSSTSAGSLNGIVLKPMIRPASITDPKFVPYALPNPVLTPALIKQVDEGSKNLVAWDIPTVRSLNTNATWTSDDTCEKGGITYKFNTDGTIVANGTADTSASKYIKLKSNFSVTKGLIASCGLPAVSQDQSKGLLQLDYPAGSDLNAYDYEISKKVDRDGTVDLYIAVLGGITVSNLIFKPMICTAADWAVSQKFVPYRPSWQEMADKTAQIGLKLVKSQTVTSNTEVTYAMNMNDFLESSPVVEGSIGTYVISVMPWSTTPTFSLYTVSYTGGSFAYTSIVKIAGTDRTVTVSNGVISISGFPSAGAKVSIHAML